MLALRTLACGTYLQFTTSTPAQPSASPNGPYRLDHEYSIAPLAQDSFFGALIPVENWNKWNQTLLLKLPTQPLIIKRGKPRRSGRGQERLRVLGSICRSLLLDIFANNFDRRAAAAPCEIAWRP